MTIVNDEKYIVWKDTFNTGYKIFDEVKNYTANNYIDIVSLITYLRNWLFNHILIEDKAFVYELKAILKKTDN